MSSAQQRYGKRAFVTVGTTEFDELIRAVTCSEVVRLLNKLGFDQIILQIGRGSFEPEIHSHQPGIELTFYRYKLCLLEDFKSADLVISHAGAGTCLEALELQKPLVVVVNETLHDNHQFELAERLAADNHLYFCTPPKLASTLRDCLSSWPPNLTPYQAGNPDNFADWLNSYLGIPTR